MQDKRPNLIQSTFDNSKKLQSFELWTGKQRVCKTELSWESIYRSKAAYVAFDPGSGTSAYFSARIDPNGLIKSFPYAYIKQGVFDPAKHTLEIVMSDESLQIEGRHLEDIYICLLENRLLLLNAGDAHKDFGGTNQTFISKIAVE